MAKLDCLKVTGLDLDAAVFLAEACEAAYGVFAPVGQAWATEGGFQTAEGTDVGNTQLFWCASDDVALLVFRGTSNPGQWIRDLRLLPGMHSWGLIHRGFGTGVRVVQQALDRFAAVAATKKHVWVTGHSLGGALAVLAGANLKILGLDPHIYTYGQPRMGYWNFADRFDTELTGRLFRFINQSDIVARVPPGGLMKHSAVPKRIMQTGVLESITESPGFESLMPDRLYNEHDQLVAQADRFFAEEAVVEPGANLLPLEKTLLTDSDIPPATEREFLMLQLQLGAASDLYQEGAALESMDLETPINSAGIFGDHAIAEYIRHLKTIRENQQAAGHP